MSRYSKVSKRIMVIFKQYDPDMLAAGIDEGYLKYVSFLSTRPKRRGVLVLMA